jgi:hypothetical protein
MISTLSMSAFGGKADIPDPLFANPNLALSVKLNVDLPCFVCG